MAGSALKNIPTGIMRNRISQQAKEAAKNVYARLFDESHSRALNLRDSIFRLAREFEAANDRPPHPSELWQEFNHRLGDDGRVSYIFNSSARQEQTYPDLYEALTKEIVPSTKTDKHRLVKGDIYATEEWLYKTNSHNIPYLLQKITSSLENYHISAADRILDFAWKNLRKPDRLAFLEGFQSRISTKELIGASAFLKNWQHSKVQIAIRREHEIFCYVSGLAQEEVFGICNLFNPENPPFQVHTYRAIRNFLSYEIEDLSELNYKASAMASLFPEYKDFVKYCRKWPSYRDGHLNLSGNADIEFWEEHYSGADYREWGEALLQYGPQILFYFKYRGYLDELPRSASGDISLKALRSEIYQELARMENVSCEERDLHEFCFMHQLSDSFQRARYLVNTYGHIARDSDFIPDINIDGTRFGMPGYSFRLLEDSDFRALFPGKFTNCCESLDKYCQNSVIHAYKTRESGFYVLTDPQDRIIAHSWVWRNMDNTLMLDGFEAKETDKRVNEGVLKNILSELSEELRKAEYADYNIPAIAIGLSGKGLMPHRHLMRMSYEGSNSVGTDWISDQDEAVFGLIRDDTVGFGDCFYLVKSYDFHVPARTNPSP